MQLSKNSYSANVTTGQLVIEHRHTNAQTTHRPRAPYLLSHSAPITAVYSLVRLHHCQCACVWRWWMYKPQHVSTFDFESLFFQGFLVTLASKKFIGLFFLNFWVVLHFCAEGTHQDRGCFLRISGPQLSEHLSLVHTSGCRTQWAHCVNKWTPWWRCRSLAWQAGQREYSLHNSQHAAGLLLILGQKQKTQQAWNIKEPSQWWGPKGWGVI